MARSCSELVCFLILYIAVQTNAEIDYCSQPPQKTLEPLTFGFNKWMHSVLIVLSNKSMVIPCCVKNYQAIHWEYNGMPVEKSNSTFSVNKTDPRYLISSAVLKSDAYKSGLTNSANYTCKAVSHEGEHITHEVSLHITNNEYFHLPMPSARPFSNIVTAGDRAIFWCSSFVGFKPFEQYKNYKLKWELHTDRNITTNATWFIYKAPGNATNIGSLLEFPKVTKEMFGLKVTCKLTKLNSTASRYMGEAFIIEYEDPTYAYKVLVIGLLSGLALVILVIGVVAGYHVEIRLMLKDLFAPLEKSDEFEWDVFICYNSKDSHDTVANYLLPRLENLGYSCFVYERDALAGEYLTVSLPARLRRSRRFLLVLSECLLRNDALAMHVCHAALQEALSPRGLRIITVQTMDQQKKLLERAQLNDALRTILTVSRKIMLPPKEGATQRQKRRFWSRVCLALPPLRQYPQHTNKTNKDDLSKKSSSNTCVI